MARSALLDATFINQKLDEIVKRVVEVAQPRKVVLFGSAARGEMTEDSDFDLLVVVDRPVHRRRLAQEIYRHLVGTGFAVDVIVVTSSDVEAHRADPSTVVHAALEEGRVVYVS